MHAQKRHACDARRPLARQPLERFGFKRAFDRANPVGPFGMAWAHFMIVARGMGQEKRCHVSLIPGGVRR
jgi:hypothetical protein